mmetsp:Transcript_15718/g.61395  ORF Transcript_15718/g.61395 Transcript_15718/m.61395 type:complete len:215 (+) Transcript_15718:1031-1675(+)
MTSGAIQSGVPGMLSLSLSLPVSGLMSERPKSHTLMVPCLSTSRLLGLRSLWMMAGLERCSQFMPLATSLAICMRLNSDSTARLLCSSCSRLPRSISSMTIAILPGSVHAPMKRRTLGWFRRLENSTSRLKSLSDLGVRSCLKSFLTATGRPRHSPSQTLPKHPPPIFFLYVISSGEMSGGPNCERSNSTVPSLERPRLLGSCVGGASVAIAVR